MTLTIKREALLQMLQKVVTVISPKQSKPIYSHVLVEIDEGRLSITSSNTELQIKVVSPFDKKHKTTFVIPARKTIEILKNLTSEEINLEIKQNKVIFSSEFYKFSLQTLEYYSFKLLDSIDRPAIIEVNAEELREAIKSTIIATLDGGTSVYFGGILFDLKPNKITAVSSDSYRIAQYDLKADIENERQLESVVVPRKTAHEIFSLLQGEHGKVKIQLNENKIAINIKGAGLVSKLLDCAFPPYEKYTFVKSQSYAIVKKEELSKALRAVSALGEKNNPETRVIVNEKGFEVSLIGQENSGKYSISNSDAKIDGEIQADLSARFLIEAIDSLSSSQTRIEFPKELTSITIKGVESANDPTHIIGLIAG